MNLIDEFYTVFAFLKGTYVDETTPDDLVVLDSQLWRPPWPGYESDGARLNYQLRQTDEGHKRLSAVRRQRLSRSAA